MKFFNNISRRDKSLLMLLLVVVVFYICYTFVISPSLQVATAIIEQTNSLKSELDNAKSLIGKEDELRKQEKDLRHKINEKYTVFLPKLDQAQLLYKMDSLMINAGIPVSAYTPTLESAAQVPVQIGTYDSLTYPLLDLAKTIQPSLYEQKEIPAAPSTDAAASPSDAAVPPTDAAAQSPDAAAGGPDMVPNVDITFGFENASYESIFAFITQVEAMNKTIVLKSSDISKNDTGLSGQLTFGFYALPTLDEKQADLLKFNPVIPKGKPNPFN